LLSNLRVLALTVEDTLLERVDPEKRRFVHYGIVGFFAVIFVVIIMGLVLSRTPSDKETASTANFNVPRSSLIPPDELFLPEEPDFVPGIMLEREQRIQWTAADAVPFWQDPLKNGEQEWRNLIEKTVDEIMESVP
jgi:hypothetical protein